MDLDEAQRRFCDSTASHIRLLAPAGCGKTTALLQRCLTLAQHSDSATRFLIVTFTKPAQIELATRVASDPAFAPIRSQILVKTLNAYGNDQLRQNVPHRVMLTDRIGRQRALRNDLRQLWQSDKRISDVANGRQSDVRKLMDIVDDLKSLGFDHTEKTTLDQLNERFNGLRDDGLWPRFEEQLTVLISLGIMDGDADVSREFLRRFLQFWRKAVETLHGTAKFSLEDQKYWYWLNLRTPDEKGQPRPPITGAARLTHILVDEFQDINPLDLALINAIAIRHQAEITIVGDDDQAIFEWRGATPRYILDPERYLDVPFETLTLEHNYRSPSNIVKHSQQLIRHNKRREDKAVTAVPGLGHAMIDVVATKSITQRLQLVSKIAIEAEPDRRVAVIGRTRSQLVPYMVYYASDHGPVKTAMDLDLFRSDGFNMLMDLLKVWDQRQTIDRESSEIITDAIRIINAIARYPINQSNRNSLRRYLRKIEGDSISDLLDALARYAGKNIGRLQPERLSKIGGEFVNASNVGDALYVVSDDFEGLRFDSEKAEEDIFYTDPPVAQLAEMAATEDLSAQNLIARLEDAKDRMQYYQGNEDDYSADDVNSNEGRPLHLMTATRSKGKEFDTVVLLDTVETLWPHVKSKTIEEIEAERRLFYVAFTRARERVIMLRREGDAPSRFVDELDLP